MTPDHESIGTTEDMDSGNSDDEGTITDEHISPRVSTSIEITENIGSRTQPQEEQKS